MSKPSPIWIEYTRSDKRSLADHPRVVRSEDEHETPLSLARQVRELRRTVEKMWAVVCVLGALVAFSLLGHCLGTSRAHEGVPPVIVPIYRDGGMCEDEPHPTPDEVWSLLEAPPTDQERRMVETVLNGCPRAPRESIDPWRVLALLRFEDALGVPASERMILAATVCQESAFQPARDLYGDDGRARGPMQLHWAWAAFCMDAKTMRTDGAWRALVSHGDFRGGLAFSARCWVAAINRALPRAAPCGERAFVVAEAIVSRAPHPLDCAARTSHARLAEEWRASL